MEGYQTGIQALLQDISGNYGDFEPQQPPLPYSRSISKSHRFQEEQSMVPRNASTPIYTQQLHHEAEASRPSIACSYGTYSDTGLDAYGSSSNMENGD